MKHLDIRPEITLSSDDVHVWVIDTQSHAFADYWTILSPDERGRIHRFRFERDRRDYFAAHVLTRLALSACASGVHPGCWTFERHSHGRPEITNPRCSGALRFNLSHSKGLAAVVVASEIDCGIDVEATDGLLDEDVLKLKVLAPLEYDHLSRLSAAARRVQFFRYWTLKEAFAKARGLGMSLPFAQISFEFDVNGIQMQSDPSLRTNSGDWQLAQWRMSSGHMVAIALRRRGKNKQLVLHRSLPCL